MKKLLYYLSLVLTAVNFIGIFAALMVAIYAPLFWNFMYDTDRLNESISQVYVEHLASTCRIVSIVVLVIMLVLIKPISTMRQKSRLSTKYDKYGRLKDDVYEKRSVKEQKKLDAQRFADMNRIIPATVVKQMTKKGSRNPEDDVAKLVGMRQVKNKIEEMAATMEFWKENDKHRGKQKEMTNHMVFFGPPGTGKTTVARIMTGFLYKYGYIEHNELIETGGSFFTTGNASMKADALCQLAYGRVLFIDEAYAMTEGVEGAEAVATIIKQMEDARGNFVLILADYADEIKALIKSNPGFMSRIKEYFMFDNYSETELLDIFRNMTEDEGYVLDDSAIDRFYIIIDEAMKDCNFGNARTCRNILEKSISRHSLNVKKGLAVGNFVLNGDDIVYERNEFYR